MGAFTNSFRSAGHNELCIAALIGHIGLFLSFLAQ
jgi:hypothetical protein